MARRAAPQVQISKGLMLLILAFLLMSAPANAEGLCDSGDAAWDAMIEQYPDDQELLQLYTLRKDLCVQVENRKISYSEAVIIFEIERGVLIEKRNQ